MKRMIAIIALVIIVLCVAGAVITGIMGSPYFLGMLFLAMVIPVLMWVFLWITRMAKGEDNLFEPLNIESNEKISNEKISNEKISNEEISNEEISNEEISNEEISNEEISNEEISNEEINSEKNK